MGKDNTFYPIVVSMKDFRLSRKHLQIINTFRVHSSWAGSRFFSFPGIIINSFFSLLPCEWKVDKQTCPYSNKTEWIIYYIDGWIICTHIHNSRNSFWTTIIHGKFNLNTANIHTMPPFRHLEWQAMPFQIEYLRNIFHIAREMRGRMNLT